MVQLDEQIYLGSDYDNIRMFDSGGMGQLFRAHKRGLDIEVVVKKVKRESKGRIDEYQEANILKGLRHQYLPSIYDVISAADGYVYTVMDYIPGVDLQKYVDQHGAVDQKTAYRWACQLCEVIGYLHSQGDKGIIHCDIKPGNIMLTPSGDICVIDFNTSLFNEENARAVGATPGYAAPEQYTVRAMPEEKAAKSRFGGETFGDVTEFLNEQGATPMRSAAKAVDYGDIGKWTDVYGIGATIYFMLTGYRPGKSLEEVIPITRYDIDATEAFKGIITKAMEYKTGDRFADAKTMLAALKNIVKIDKRYKTFLRARNFTYGLLALVFLAGVGCLTYGIRLMGGENTSHYIDLLNQGITYVQEGNYDQGYETFHEAIAMYPDYAEGYNFLGSLMYSMGKYEECAALAEEMASDGLKSVDGNPDGVQSDICSIGGSCYYQLGDYDKAIQFYRTAAELTPEDPDCQRDLAIALAAAGQLKEARSIAETIENISGESADVCMVKAEIEHAAGNDGEALALYDKVFALTTDSAVLSRAYLLAAQICEALGDEYLEREISILESAVEALGSQGNLLHMDALASAYSRLGTADGDSSYFTKALVLYEKLYDRGQTNFTTLLNIGTLQMKLKDYKDAETTLLSLCRGYQNDYRGYMYLALCYLEYEEGLEGTARNYDFAVTAYLFAEERYGVSPVSGQGDMEMLSLRNYMKDVENVYQIPVSTMKAPETFDYDTHYLQ